MTAFLNFYMIKMTSMPNNWNMSKWYFFLKGYHKTAHLSFHHSLYNTYIDAPTYISPIYHLPSTIYHPLSSMYIQINFSSIPCIFLFACSWVKIQPEKASQVNSKSSSAADAWVKNYHIEMLTCMCKNISKTDYAPMQVRDNWEEKVQTQRRNLNSHAANLGICQ